VRQDPRVVLSMLGCATVWRPDALRAVAALEEKMPVYLELWLPSAAHHLGWRVRGLGAQDAFIHYAGDESGRLDEHRRAGAWLAHPVKRFWESPRPLQRP
jgi:hypothetical protein